MASGAHYHYHSDDSTFNGTRGKPRHRHNPTASDTSYTRSARHGRRRNNSAPHPEDTHSAASTFGKVALGVIFVQVVSTCFSMWMNKKDDEKYKAQQQQDRRRDFEKAKAKRRRDEERQDREEEERERKERDRWEKEEIITEGRRIGFVESPPSDSEESEKRSPRRIEAPPEWDQRTERGISVGGKSIRARSTDGRSVSGRPARGKSAAGRADMERERERASKHGRSRSRPAMDV